MKKVFLTMALAGVLSAEPKTMSCRFVPLTQDGKVSKDGRKKTKWMQGHEACIEALGKLSNNLGHGVGLEFRGPKREIDALKEIWGGKPTPWEPLDPSTVDTGKVPPPKR